MTTTFTLSGLVISVTTGGGIEGVTVVVTDGPRIGASAITDANGNYSISRLLGGMTVSADAGGFAEQLKSVTVTADTTLDFELTEEPTGVRGRLTNILVGGGLGGITARVPGVASTTTGANGRYELDLMGISGLVALVFSGPGVWTRETHTSVNSIAGGDSGLIPQGGDFDMNFFDHIFRRNGSSGTTRWLGQPSFEIWTREFDCTESSGSTSCTSMTATADNVPNAFEGNARTAIANDPGPLTGGFIAGAPVTTRAHATGDVITSSQMMRDGVISIVFINTRFTTKSWASWQTVGDGRTVAAHVQIHSSHRDIACVFSHELAHTLGYEHPDGQFNVPGDSVMRCDGVTADDRLHGRVLYLRPPGSRTPDTDPPDFSLDASTAGFGRGMRRTFEAH